MKKSNTTLKTILNRANAFNHNVSQRFNAFCALVFTSLFFSNNALADYDIGGPEEGPWAAVIVFVQDVINLIDGPIALAFSFISLVGMAITWAIAPKMMNAMGTFARVMIAVVIILNIGVWITALSS